MSKRYSPPSFMVGRERECFRLGTVEGERAATERIEQLEAERDRYRDALECIEGLINHVQQAQHIAAGALDELDRLLARVAALTPIEEQT